MLAVYTGSSVDALMEVASNDDSSLCRSGTGEGALRFSAAAGTTYYIAIDGKNGAAGHKVAGRADT